MLLEIALIVVGLALFVYGHKQGRLQLRAIGAGVAAFGAVSLVLPFVFG